MNKRLDALDGWRTVAVVLVIIHHFFLFYVPPKSLGIGAPKLGELGRLGVTIFFVISGYVICSGLKKEQGAYGRISLSAFYIRRTLRILPPLALYLLTVASLNTFGIVTTPYRQIVHAACFSCNLNFAGCSSWQIAHTWSLAYEEQFYIVFPLLLILLTPKKRLFLLCAFFTLPFAVLICSLAGQDSVADYLKTVEFLLAGVVLSLFSNELGPRIARLRPPAIYLMTAAFFAIAHLKPAPLTSFIKSATLGPMIAIVLYYTSHFPCLLKRLLSYPAICFVGRISYSIYLWQQLVSVGYQVEGPVLYCLLFVAMVAVCLASFQWMEKPLIRLAARLSKQRIQKGLPALAHLPAN